MLMQKIFRVPRRIREKLGNTMERITIYTNDSNYKVSIMHLTEIGYSVNDPLTLLLLLFKKKKNTSGNVVT